MDRRVIQSTSVSVKKQRGKYNGAENNAEHPTVGVTLW
jgi:hypothetical protein